MTIQKSLKLNFPTYFFSMAPIPTSTHSLFHASQIKLQRAVKSSSSHLTQIRTGFHIASCFFNTKSILVHTGIYSSDVVGTYIQQYCTIRFSYAVSNKKLIFFHSSNSRKHSVIILLNTGKQQEQKQLSNSSLLRQIRCNCCTSTGWHKHFNNNLLFRNRLSLILCLYFFLKLS